MTTCADCGGPGQPCCSNHSCTSSGYACNGDTCAQCGAAGQTCCAGDLCNGSSLACSDGTCKQCGGPTQPCCTGGTCNSGNCCDPTTVNCIAGSNCPAGLCGNGNFDVHKDCNASTDCAFGLHEISCCGSQVAYGYNSMRAADFTQREMEWEAACPMCACSALPLAAEDGKMCAQSAITVTCDNQQCMTHCP
jgi:hypothetical protein